MQFTNLHVNSTYTYLKSGLDIDKYISFATKNDLKNLSLTDFNSFTASLYFSNKIKALGIKSILGIDFLIEDFLVTFIVKSEEGYKNLLYISKLFNTEKLDTKSIRNHTNGLVGIISSKESKLYDKLVDLNDEHFAFKLKEFNDSILDLYIGLEIYNKEDKIVADKLRAFLNNRYYKLVAFPFVKYLKKEDAISLLIAEAIKEEKTLDPNVTFVTGDYYFRNLDEVKELYLEEEINNTSKIVDSVNFSLDKKRGKLIKYVENSDEVLKKLSFELLEKKIHTITNEYKSRLEYELDVIKKMGYSDYFLVVMDYVKFAKNKGIYVGPGRGSAGGSLVAFALDIITIDPIKNNLIFERFLNEGRNSMPDIDVDFEDVRREEVVSYLKEKYGLDRVSMILTTQTIKAKQALRDVAKIYNISDYFLNNLLKTLGDYDGLRLGYKRSPNFRKLIDSDKEYLKIVTFASKVEGFPRQSGMHAAGVIINDEPLDESLPVYIDSNYNLVSQYEKDDLEHLGFLKMDILGLKNLTVIKEIIEEENSKGASLVYEDIPYEDKEPITLIAKGETLGLFQLESKGMIRTCLDFQPTCFEDIVTLLALFRPGPMDYIPRYIARKNNKEKIIYPSEKIKEILLPTYGIIVYQEQIMQIVRKMANYSYSKADLFRRAISKKDASKLAALKDEFIIDSINNGNSKKESEDVFNLIYNFANYGFNRSHALAYAKIACQMAYLKYHYPLTFYAKILDSDDKFSDVIAELRKRNISLGLPDINLASYVYRPFEDKIIMPFNKISGIMNQHIQSLIIERDNNGPYVDFVDFIRRNYKYGVSKSTVIKLIDVGAFDSFNINRNSLRNAVDRVFDYSKLVESESNQNYFDISIIDKPNIDIVVDDEIYNVEQEYNLLGINISKSPLDFYQEQIEKDNLVPISKINFALNNIRTIGIIRSIRRIKTKFNKSMCFITLSDNILDVNITVFSELYIKHEEELYDAKILEVIGRYQKDRKEIIAEEIKVL